MHCTSKTPDLVPFKHSFFCMFLFQTRSLQVCHVSLSYRSLIPCSNARQENSLFHIFFTCLSPLFFVLFCACAGGDPNLCAKSKSASPLYEACKEGHLECVVTLLKSGADPHLANCDGIFPIHIASLKGFEK